MERIKIDEEKTEREIYSRLEKGLALLEKKEEAAELLKLLFSPTEKERFAKRLEILKKLRKDSSYKEIKKTLNVSDNTIAQMSNALKVASPQALKTVDRLIREDLAEEGAGLRFSTSKETR